jgi:hypothetical protein
VSKLRVKLSTDGQHFLLDIRHQVRTFLEFSMRQTCQSTVERSLSFRDYCSQHSVQTRFENKSQPVVILMKPIKECKKRVMPRVSWASCLFLVLGVLTECLKLDLLFSSQIVLDAVPAF